MFDALRRMIVPIIIIVLVFFAGMIVLEWGLGLSGRQQAADANVAGKFNGRQISWQAYNNIVNNLVRSEQEQTDEDLLRAIELYENLGDSAQVLHYAEQLYEADPSGQNLVIYTRALIADGRSEQASPLVEKGLEQSESSAVRSSLLTLRASLIEGESPAEAYTLLREAVMENPENVAALIGIADLYVEQRELRKATLYLKVALTLDPENTALRVRLQSLERALESEPSL